jgi:hypothetical protein
MCICFMVLGFALGGNRDIPTVLVLMGVLAAYALTAGALVIGLRTGLGDFAEERKKQLAEAEDRIDAMGRVADPMWSDNLINRIHRQLRNGDSTKAVAMFHAGAGVTWDEAHRQLRKWQNVGMAVEKLDLLSRALSGSQATSV